MALDIYVGSLTRFHLSDWETAAARLSRELGIPYKAVEPESESPQETATDPLVVKEAVLAWRTSLEAALRQHLKDGLSWNEEPDTPYFTERPSWDGYAGLVLLSAHTEQPGFPLPERATSEWRNDSAYQAVTSADFKSRFAQFYEIEMWLPCPFSFKFKAPDVTGAEVWFGSSPELLKQLRRLSEATSQTSSGRDQPANREAADEAGSFAQSARFGLEMFLRLAQQSVEHRLPMKLAY